MNKQIDVNALKQICPLPHLMQLVGLGQYAKSSCPSPFRQDQKASWGIFQYEGRWMYKDFGTGEVGDEIGLLANLHNLDPHDDFRAVLKIYQDIVDGKGNGKASRSKGTAASFPPAPKAKRDATGLALGTYDQIERLSQLRGISMEGLLFAQERGVLICGDFWGFEVYGVKDQTGRLIEVRLLNGDAFFAWGGLPARKSHALKGSHKDWPLGIMEANGCESLALAEGLPDFLALHQYVVQEKAQDRVGPVGMLSSACLISPGALEHFKGKHVRIYPHMDQA